MFVMLRKQWFKRYFKTAYFTSYDFTLLKCLNYNHNVHSERGLSFKSFVLEVFLNDGNYAASTNSSQFSKSPLLNLNTRHIDNNLKPEELLRIVNNLYLNSPYKVVNNNAFVKTIPLLEGHMIKDELTIYQKIQSMYYVSLLKSNSITKRFMNIALKKTTKEELIAISNKDLGIFCISLFQSSVPICDKDILNLITYQLKLNIKESVTDRHFPTTFVSFIKCLRHSKFYDDHLFEVISDKLFVADHWISKLSLTSTIHLIVYFCDAMYSNLDVIRLLMRKCMHEIENKIVSKEAVRMKDLDNLLWSASKYCDLEINTAINESLIVLHIKEAFKSNVHPPNVKINILLWLLIAQCRIEELVSKYLTTQNISYITASKNFKDISKMNLLLTCINLEAPDLVTFDFKKMQDNRLMPRFGPYLSGRPLLKTVLDWLEKYKQEYGLTNISLCFQVPQLFIGGIRADYLQHAINIEVIDESVCLRNSSRINGSMVLKFRLLRRMNERVIAITLKQPLLNNIDEELKSQLVKGIKELKLTDMMKV